MSEETIDGQSPREERPLRIAVVAACPFPYPRGTPIRISRTAGALARRGHDVHVVSYHLGDGDVEPGVTVHRTPSVPTYSRVAPGPSLQKLLVMDPLLAITLRRVLRKGRFDLLHAHHFEGLGAAFLAKPSGLPLVFDVHTLLATELPSYDLWLPKWLLRSLGGAIDRALPGTADHIVSVTKDIEDRLLADCDIPPTQISVVENGIQIERFTTSSATARAPRDPLLVFAGNLAP